MIYSQFALFVLRVFNMAHRVALTPQPPFIDYSHIHHPTPVMITERHSGEVHANGANDAQPESGTRMRRILGDVQIGALFPIHRKKKGSESCGEIWEQYGIHRTEAALKTIDEINKDASILANVRLGIDIRDDCWTERRAMEETIEFIREVIGTGPSSSSATCTVDTTAGPNNTNILLAAVVGPANSDMSIATHNLLQVFRIPQIGYAATTSDLSDKSDFKYYMRLVPSDSYQAQALVDIAVHFKWTYIGVIYSNGNYGEKGFEQMQRYIDRRNSLCIAYMEKIDSLAPPQRFDELLASLLKVDPRPRAAICFCEGDTMRRIFEAMKRRKMRSYGKNDTDLGGIQWIGSESWSDRGDVVKDYEDVAKGGISLRIYSPRVESFDPYFLKWTPFTNKHNPWFGDFWEERFNCSLGEETAHRYSKKCTGHEDLSNGYMQDPKINQVVNSIYTVAYGLDAMYRNVCVGYTGRGLCPAMRKLNGSILFDYMLNVRFNDSHGQEISFDHNGDIPARYDILSYQGDSYVLAGEWRSIISVNENGTTTYKQNLTIHADKLMWHDGSFAKDAIIESVCSRPCPFGHVKKMQTTKTCCWTCVRCLDNEYVADETTCRNCSRGDWPTDNRTSCFKLELEYLRSGSPEAIAVMVLSCIGILATLYTTVIFARFNATPVVKATTRELSYIILIGIFLCYATTFVIVIQPNTVTCYVLRILPGFAFSMIYGALLTKTNRIARILAGSKKRILTKKPRFLSTRAQVVITWMLVSVELVIMTAVLIYEPANADYDHRIAKRVLLVCETSTLSFLAPFGFDFFLITLCTLYAVKTRNLPENFNEAKFIGFTMYTTCIIWLAFITIYFGSNNKGITMCLSFTLSASVALVLLFFPKLYIILFQPHKNVRSSYATTKVIRCHFGTNRSSTISQHDSHRYKPRTSSSGPKTQSTVSRPSSKASKNEMPVSDSGCRLKKQFMRDSVHVSIPQMGTTLNAVSSGQAKENALGSVKDASSLYSDASPSSQSSRHIRSGVYFRNELSVIEESMMSHDDSLQSQTHLASFDQQQHQHQIVANLTPIPVRSEACQTDPDVFDEYVKYWVLQKHCLRAEEMEETEEGSEGDKRRSMSLRSRGPSIRRRSDISVAGGGKEEMEEKHYEFKRTYTEYRKGSKRIRRPDGTRLKLLRQPSMHRKMSSSDGSTEQLAALISRRQSWRSEPTIDEADASELPFMMRVNALAPIDAVISSSVEEFKRRNTLKRRNRKGASSPANAVAEMEGEQAEGEEEETNLENRLQPKRSINVNTPFGDIMAQTLGGAFQTFIGPAVPVDEKEDFYITTEVIEEADEEAELQQQRQQDEKRASLIGQMVESSFEALVGGEFLPQASGAGDGSNGSIVGGSASGPSSVSKMDRKGSLLSRLGHSIRKKIRRFSGDAAAKAFEEFNTQGRYDSRSRHSSIGEPSMTALGDDFETSVVLAEVPEHEPLEGTATPDESPPTERGPDQLQRQRRSRYSRRMPASDTDTGIDRQLEEETESGIRWRRQAPVSDTTGATITTIANVCPTAPTNTQAAANELESLLQSQGLEPVEFSHSTLV